MFVNSLNNFEIYGNISFRKYELKLINETLFEELKNSKENNC